MPTSVVPYQNSVDGFIMSAGAPANYYGGSVQPAVFTDTHAPIVSAMGLDGLEIASSKNIYLTAKGNTHSATLSVDQTQPLHITEHNTGPLATSVTASTCNVQASLETLEAKSQVRTSVGASSATANAAEVTCGTGSSQICAGAGSGNTLRTSSSIVSAHSGHISLASPAGQEFFVAGEADAAISTSGSLVQIRKDIDIRGQLNNVSASSVVLRINDNRVKLASKCTTDSEIGGDDTGMSIETVPPVDVVSKFTNNDGTPLFVAGDGSIDKDKAVSAKLFEKHLAFKNRAGAKMLGVQNVQGRTTEPTWCLDGGALRITRDVPKGGGLATRVSICMRIDDFGNLEINRISRPMTWNVTNNLYTEGLPVVDELERFDVDSTSYAQALPP